MYPIMPADSHLVLENLIESPYNSRSRIETNCRVKETSPFFSAYGAFSLGRFRIDSCLPDYLPGRGGRHSLRGHYGYSVEQWSSDVSQRLIPVKL
jgi:hypothetical protein